MKEYDAAQYMIDILDLRQVFDHYGYELKRGDMCCCPFHSERTPSCSVSRKLFHCFGCNAGGNVIGFTKRLFNVDFKIAVRKLNADFGLGLLDREVNTQELRKMRAKSRQLTPEQQRQKELEELRKEYEEAWRVAVIYEPQSPLEPINPLFIEASNKVNQLDWIMDAYGWRLTREDAISIFTKRR